MSVLLSIIIVKNIYWIPTKFKFWAEKKSLSSRSFWSVSTTFSHKKLSNKERKINKNNSALSECFYYRQTNLELINEHFPMHTLPMLCVNVPMFVLRKDWNRHFMWQWFVNLSWKKNVLLLLRFHLFRQQICRVPAVLDTGWTAVNKDKIKSHIA